MATKAQKKIELNAERRSVLGRKVKQLRDSGYIPAVLYGKDQESISLQILAKDFEKVLKAAGESTLIYVNANGQSYPTIIHDVMREPVRDEILHADFYKVRLDEKIKTSVPVVFEGEAPAVKELLGIFVRNVNELEVEAFPQDLPHEIKIDISVLKNFGDQVLLKDINLGDKVQVIGEADEIIATIQEPKSEEELEAELAEPTTDVSAVEELEKIKTEEELLAESEGESAPAAAQEAPVEEKKNDLPAGPLRQGSSEASKAGKPVRADKKE